MATSKSSAYDGRNVYWAARDIEYFPPVGNHHFIVMTFHHLADSPNPDQTVAVSDGHGRRIYVLCYALFPIWPECNVEIKVNSAEDLRAFDEFFCNTQSLLPDLDFEGHKIPPPQGMDMTAFMQCINDAALRSKDYLAAHLGHIKYNPLNKNCATWVNDLMTYVGVPEDVRRAKNDFLGLDVGHDSTAFLPTFQ